MVMAAQQPDLTAADRAAATRSRLEPADGQARHFDLLLSYHTPDQPVVESVRSLLQARGLRSFIDRDHLVVGLPWPQQLERP